MLTSSGSRTDKLSDLIWSPVNENEFVAYGNDLHLFKVVDKNALESQPTENFIELSDDSLAEQIAHFADNSTPRIVTWYMGNDSPYTFAVNFADHNIKLISLNSNAVQQPNKKHRFEIVKEFSFKQMRQSNSLAFNPFKTNYLAAGFERIRNEHSILVWDIKSSGSAPNAKFEANNLETVIYSTNIQQTNASSAIGSSFNSSLNSYAALYTSINNTNLLNGNKLNAQLSNGSGGGSEQKIIRPVYETGRSDTCTSLEWSPHSENLLLVGMNAKTLKIYDIRGKFGDFSFDLI